MLKHLVAATAVVLCWVAPALSEEIVKVTVRSSGTVLLDGKKVTLPALEKRFKALKAAKGTVWYHRQNPGAATAPKEATAVVELIIKYDLPVSLSANPDFSDYVDDKGVSRPRRR
jgi:hypothetical protein